MKLSKVLTAFVSALLMLCSFIASTQEIKISGVVEGSALARVKSISTVVQGAVNTIKIESGKFSTTLYLNKPQFIVLQVGVVSKNLFAIPGRDLNLTLKRHNYSEPMVISCDDKDLSLINSVLDVFFISLTKQGVDVSEKGWLQKQSVLDSEMGQVIDNAYASASAIIDANESLILKLAPSLSQDLKFVADNFKKYVAIDNYSLRELELRLSELLESNLKLYHLSLPFIQEYVLDVTTAYAVRKLDRYKLDLSPQTYRLAVVTMSAEAMAKALVQEQVKDVFFRRLIEDELAGYGLGREGYLSLLFENVNESKVTDLRKAYFDLKKKEDLSGPRQDLLNFEVVDVNGNTHTLDEFRGKLIYIDFWASWCAPCKQQIPFIKKLEEHYVGKDIVFVGISVDAKKDAWLASVKTEGLSGNTFYAEGDFNHPAVAYYNIKSIPRFMLVDAQGKVISDDAIRPSQTDNLMEVINAELYKSELSTILDGHIAKVGGDKLLGGMGVLLKNKAAVMGIELFSAVYYKFPGKIRTEAFPLGAPNRESKVMSAMALSDNIVTGKGTDIEKFRDSWVNKVSGLELFIMLKDLGLCFEFAKDNFSNQENEYVVQTTLGDNVIKVFLGKDDLLMHKLTITSAVTARNGGGTSVFTYLFSDYKEINGVPLPWKVTLNGMVDTIVEEAEVKRLDDSLFTI